MITQHQYEKIYSMTRATLYPFHVRLMYRYLRWRRYRLIEKALSK